MTAETEHIKSSKRRRPWKTFLLIAVLAAAVGVFDTRWRVGEFWRWPTNSNDVAQALWPARNSSIQVSRRFYSRSLAGTQQLIVKGCLLHRAVSLCPALVSASSQALCKTAVSPSRPPADVGVLLVITTKGCDCTTQVTWHSLLQTAIMHRWRGSTGSTCSLSLQSWCVSPSSATSRWTCTATARSGQTTACAACGTAACASATTMRCLVPCWLLMG